MRRFDAIRAKYFPKDPFGDLDVSELFYGDERADPVQWLTECGWSVQRVNPLELAAAYGRPVPELPEELADLSKRSSYLTAVK